MAGLSVLALVVMLPARRVHRKAVGSSCYLLTGAYRGPTRVSFGCIGVKNYVVSVLQEGRAQPNGSYGS